MHQQLNRAIQLTLRLLRKRKQAIFGAFILLLSSVSLAQSQGTVPVRAQLQSPIASPSVVGGGGGGDPPPPATAYFEQGILSRSGEVIQGLGPNLMGDAVNEYSGGLEFTQTDVSLPGNNALAVQIGRHKAAGTTQAYGGTGHFGDWDLDIPHMHTVATQKEPNWYGGRSSTNFSRCSQFLDPPFSTTVGQIPAKLVLPDTFWDGYHLYVPGGGDQTLLLRSAANTTFPSDGTAAQYGIVTKQHWQISCLSTLDNAVGEGFEARSPDGVRYRFDHMATRVYKALSKPGPVPRIEVWLLPTLVTDRFGNWVRYTYAGADGWRLTTITSSDGRQITISYPDPTSHRIQSISDGSRNWSYGYSASGSLQTVTQPDMSSWTFAIDALAREPYAAGDPGCDTDDDWSNRPPISGTITHPSGAVGTFVLSMTTHGRSAAPGTNCVSTHVGRFFANWSLTSKTLSGPGMSAMTWSYAYSAAQGSFAPCNGCANTKTVTITDPLGSVSVDTFGTEYAKTDGLLLNSVQSSGGATLRSTSYTYAAPGAGPYPASIGGIKAPADSMSNIHTPQLQRVIFQQSVYFTNAATGFDVFARTTGVNRSSNPGTSRSESTTYYDQLSLWVLGQVATRTIAGLQTSSTSFFPSSALPSASYSFGKLINTYVFNADGTLQSVSDGLNHTTTYSSYNRGLAQIIGYADGTSMSAVVNPLGLITSVTNEAGTTWGYSYDAMGRLASATPPGGYNTKYLSFVQVPYAEVGIGANHWRQTITTGNAVTINYFDARWRKLLTTTYDAANIGATQRAQAFSYDPYNRAIFASYPARSIASIASPPPGVVSVFDGLGRSIQTQAASELGTLTTTINYLSGFQKQVVNPRGFSTTTAYQVFDEPSESAMVTMRAPEDVNVSISRDAFSKPTAITRYGTAPGTPSVTRSYVYDNNQRLCKTIEPETGATIQLLDAADNVAWRATGLGLTNLASCDWSSVPGTSIVAYWYDARNRVTGTGYGDLSASIGRSYTADGLPLTVVSNGSTWTYGYDARRLLTSEALAYSSTFNIGRTYDGNGNLSQLTYPDGGAVAFSPNALGEPTQVGGYASGVTYHPNGAVASYTLGNGIAYSLTQNTRGLPFVSRDAGVVQDQYAYDANGNVASITDQQEGVTSRSMGYDGFDRLVAANAPGVWGSAVYGYDVLDNIRSSSVGTRSSVYNYNVGNSRNLLDNISINGSYLGYSYDARGNVNGRGSVGFYFDLGNRMNLANGLASYTYDGWGRRVSTSNTNGMNRTQVYSQAGQLLYAFSQQGMSSWLTRYVYLGSKLIAESDTSAGTTYAHSDALGSPVARTNGSGQLVSRTRYEPYGATAAGTNPGSNGFIGVGFTGHVNDAETGLVYMQQRYYDPSAGRFLSVDPITTEANTGGKFNLYEYAANNPYTFTDPDGQDPWYLEPQQVVSKQYFTGSNIPQKTVITMTPGGGITGATTSGPMGSGLSALRASLAYWLSSSVDAARADGIGGAIQKTLGGLPAETAALGMIGKLGKTEEAASALKATGDTFFKTSHYGSRLERAGVDVAGAEAAVMKEVNAMRANMATNADTVGRLTVNGVQVEYRARLLPNGTVNIGTLFPVTQAIPGK